MSFCLEEPLDLAEGLGCGCSSGLGDAANGKCGILIPAIAGAIAFWAIPPLLTGFVGGMRDEYRDQQKQRSRRRK